MKEDTHLEIEPIAFRPGGGQGKPKRFFHYKWLTAVTTGLILVLLAASVWYVFTAKRVVIHIDPEPDRLTITGGLASPRFRGYYLLRPGNYRLRAMKECYHPLERPFRVEDKTDQEIRLSMEKLPGQFSLVVNRSDETSVEVEGAQVYVDGKAVGVTPIADMEMDSGQRHLEIRAENYLDLDTDVVIRGCSEHQAFAFALVPGWSDVSITSIPQRANVSVDGKPAGNTPLTIQLLQGSYHLAVGASGFETWETTLAVQANQHQELAEIRLEPADGILMLETSPPGADVTIGDTYLGRTPLEMPLSKKTIHDIRISKTGYETVSRQVEVPAAKTKKLTVNLKAKEGIIHFAVEPPGAELVIDGKTRGPVPHKLTLIATKHAVAIQKEGYETYRTEIVPRPGFPQEIKIALTKLGLPVSARPKATQAKNGYPLKLIRPTAFTMGSSRREQGRRSNETLRKIQLQRPFYIGIREVTNKEFREYLNSHTTGSFKGHNLDGNELPVAQVTWQQAAMFCNWLSSKESFPPAYIKKGEELVAADSLGHGYRLPTEAEWEYCARFVDKQAPLKYPWGNTFPPKSGAGNYADVSVKGLLSEYLKDYHDGYPISAPPGSFPANDLGIFDLGGNVAEWCHDYYGVYSYDDDKVYLDPKGPGQGKHHVVRGSSWRHASISTLRLSYRDYNNDKRSDLGFRVCRYVE